MTTCPAAPYRRATRARTAGVVLVALLIGLALPAPAGAATRPLRFDRLSLQDGLSQTTVLTIFQDRQGFIWLGTEDGLNRFDGYRFTVFKHDPDDPGSIPGDAIWDIAEDRDGGLWVATEQGGLARWDRTSERFTAFRHDPNRSESLASDSTRALAIDEAGMIWVGFLDEGLDRLDPSTGRVVHLPAETQADGQPRRRAVYALATDGTGTLWVGSDDGLDRVDTTTLTATAMPLEAPRVRALHLGSTGQLYLGTMADGLIEFTPRTGATRRFRHAAGDTTSLSHDEVRAIRRADGGGLWIGTAEGLDLFDAARGTFDHYRHDPSDADSLSDDYVMALFRDRGGIMWAGTRFGGVSKWDTSTWRFGRTAVAAPGEPGLSEGQVTAFAKEPEGDLWVGTFGGGVHRFNTRTGAVTHYRMSESAGGLSDDRVTALLIDRRSRVWVGTYQGGLNRLDPGGMEFTRYVHAADDARTPSAAGIMSLHEDRRGRIWIGTFGGGLNRYEEATDDFVRYPVSQVAPRVTGLADDRLGGLWVSTDGGGLYRLPADGRPPRRFPGGAPGALLPTASLTTVHAAENDDIWLGTRGNGLVRLRNWSGANPAVTVYSEKDGLTNDVVYGVEPDARGNLWLSTNNGLFRFNPADGSFTAFGPEDGLQAAEFNFGSHYRDRKGLLYFGGIAGFNAFDPAAIRPAASAAPIVLTSVLKFNRPVPRGEMPWDTSGVQLGYEDSVVTFEFAMLDYAAPGRNRYRYRLDGFTDDWIELGPERRITFTNLDSGRYALQVQAATPGGPWSAQGLSVSVGVEPPPWKQWWAYAIYAAMFAAGLVALNRERQRRRQREVDYRNQLEREVAERTQQLAERADELQRLNEQLSEASLSDSLTGMRNRRFLFEYVGQEMKAVRRRLGDARQRGQAAEHAAVFMLVDLDHFKTVNDTYGHLVGDEILIEMTRRLRGITRESDLLIRWGGDEFLLVTRDADPEAAARMAERVRQTLGAEPIVTRSGLSLPASCTVGFACFPFLPDHPEAGDWEDTIGLADLALYAAKRTSRNTWAGALRTEKTPRIFQDFLHASVEGLEAEGLVEFRRSGAPKPSADRAA